jgi:mono/diheme cytochrome c family protein
MDRRLPQFFFALSLIALTLIVAAVWQSGHPSWKQYQIEFHRMESQAEPNAAAKAAIVETSLAVRQDLLTGLQRVDRCTTCHLGVEDPTMKNAPEPYRYHAGLAPHVPAKFGCTVCHGGQGLATDKENAHGNVAFWEEPLLPKEYVRASCGRCHKEGDIPGVPELTEGRRLFESQGCRGCHKLNSVGGSIGPDLSTEGASRRAPEWLERHFLNPNVVSPHSPMPNFHFTRDQARALTFYMLSLTNGEMASYYSSVRLIPSAGYGRQLFVDKNCIACHNIGGVGAKSGPDLAGVTQQHSREWLDEQLVNPQLVYPGSIMPAYDLEMNARKALIAFMSTASSEDAQAILTKRGKPLTADEAAIEAGKQDFARFGCAGCHGVNLQGGVPNPNSQGGEVPSLLHAADDYTKDEVITIISNGKQPPLENSAKPAPPLYMPSWKTVLSGEDISRIADYLWSVQTKKEAW